VLTTELRHAKQQEAPQLPLDNPAIQDCCKVPSNLELKEYRPDVVARWECAQCGRRHFRAFMPINPTNVAIE